MSFEKVVDAGQILAVVLRRQQRLLFFHPRLQIIQRSVEYQTLEIEETYSIRIAKSCFFLEEIIFLEKIGKNRAK